MITFTPTQNKTIAVGLTVLSVSVVIAFVSFTLWGLLKILDFISPAITPVILGIFLSMLFKPFYQCYYRLTNNSSLAFMGMIITVLLPIGLLIWFCGEFLIDQIAALVTVAPTIMERLSAWVVHTFPKAQDTLVSLGISDERMLFFTDPATFSCKLLSQLSSSYGTTAMKAGVGALKYLTGLGTFLVTMIFFAFFVTREPFTGSDYVKQMPFLKEDTRKFVARQIDTFFAILIGFFQRQVIICIIEGLLYGIGFMLVGLPYGFVLGFILGALNLVPLFGTIVVLPMALPIAFFGDGGSVLRLIGVTAVWLTGQVLDNYFITPKIQGDKTGLGFAGVIFSFLFWGIVFHSMLGLLLAIPLSAFCVVLWCAIKEKITGVF